jgi:hypothetical protein
MAREQHYSENWEDVGRAVSAIDAAMKDYRQLSVLPTGFSVRGPRARGDEILLVVRGIDADEAPVVAFHSAFSLGEALRGLEGRLSNGTLKWKPDEFRK